MSDKKISLIDIIASEKFQYYYIAAIMLLVPVCELVTELFGITYISQPTVLELAGLTGIIQVLCYFVKNIKGEKIYYPSDIFFVLLFLFSAISLIFSKDIENSVTGYNYDELPIHFAAYYCLMFAGTHINDKRLRKNILYVFCAVALLQGVVAFFQTFGFRIVDCLFGSASHAKYNMAYGLTHNSNWFAGISCIFCAVSLGLFMFSDNNRIKRYMFLALGALSFYVSLCTTARIAWVGNICIILFYLVSFSVMKRRGYASELLRERKRRFGIFMLMWAVVLVIIILCKDSVFRGILDFINEGRYIKENNGSLDALGSNRFYIWRYGLEAVPDNWLTGVGLDNYRYAFFSNPSWEPGMFYQDKGHNEYIHTLVTQGVFAAVNYILLLVYSAVTGVKNVMSAKDEEERGITWVLLGMFVAYASQAFFNSSVINTAFYFWIIVGMTMPYSMQKNIRRLRIKK